MKYVLARRELADESVIGDPPIVYPSQRDPARWWCPKFLRYTTLGFVRYIACTDLASRQVSREVADLFVLDAVLETTMNRGKIYLFNSVLVLPRPR